MLTITRMVHIKCRNSIYPGSQISRFEVPDNLVSWCDAFINYSPVEYNSTNILNKPWADPNIGDVNFKPNWNNLDGKINRKSYTCDYAIVDGRPRNSQGRTGLTGRGLLGRWGPNHAADPVVTRWKRVDAEKLIDKVTNLPVLQFCAIQRRDCNEWAIPGGMVDPGENVSETLKREFLEEALNSLENNDEKANAMVSDFFTQNGTEIYKGYVDDPRNTDNAWMETVAINFHDENGETVGKLALNAGDDAKGVRWMDINKEVNLYASHTDFIEKVVKLRNAHW